MVVMKTSCMLGLMSSTVDKHGRRVVAWKQIALLGTGEAVFVLEPSSRASAGPGCLPLTLTKVLTRQGKCGWVQTDGLEEVEDDGWEGC